MLQANFEYATKRVVIDIHAKIRARIESFVMELTDLIEQATAEAVNAALRDEIGAMRRELGAPVAPRRAGRRGRGGGLRPGQKRSPEVLKALEEQIYKYLEEHPGVGVEQIGKDLGASTSELTLPIHKLLKEKRIRRKGQKRATRYFPREVAAA